MGVFNAQTHIVGIHDLPEAYMTVNIDTIAAVRVGDELVCFDCLMENEKRFASSDIVSYAEVEAMATNDLLTFCDRCNKLIE